MLRSLLITIAVLIASMPAAAQTTHWSATGWRKENECLEVC